MFTLAFWKTALEHSLVAGGSAFAGAMVWSTTPDWKDLQAALVAAGLGALYAFVKQLGGIQATAAIVKVKVGLHTRGDT